MLEQLSEDYIRTARASGLPGWYIVLCYALPNALIPSITVLGLALGDLLYGAVLTETVFAWPGMGAWVVTSIQALDFPAVMGFAVVVSFAYVLVNWWWICSICGLIRVSDVEVVNDAKRGNVRRTPTKTNAI